MRRSSSASPIARCGASPPSASSRVPNRSASASCAGGQTTSRFSRPCRAAGHYGAWAGSPLLQWHFNLYICPRPRGSSTLAFYSRHTLMIDARFIANAPAGWMKPRTRCDTVPGCSWTAVPHNQNTPSQAPVTAPPTLRTSLLEGPMMAKSGAPARPILCLCACAGLRPGSRATPSGQVARSPHAAGWRAVA